VHATKNFACIFPGCKKAFAGELLAAIWLRFACKGSCLQTMQHYVQCCRSGRQQLQLVMPHVVMWPAAEVSQTYGLTVLPCAALRCAVLLQTPRSLKSTPRSMQSQQQRRLTQQPQQQRRVPVQHLAQQQQQQQQHLQMQISKMMMQHQITQTHLTRRHCD
jgi:hypothetical protein